MQEDRARDRIRAATHPSRRYCLDHWCVMRERTREPAAILAAWVPPRRWVGLIAAGVLVALLVGAILSQHVIDQTARMMTQTAEIVDIDNRLATQTAVLRYQSDGLAKIWTTMVQVVAGALVVGGIWRGLQVAQEGQITDRFTQAIAQLEAELKDGVPNVGVRLGGIYALERIARESRRDHWTIMEILTAYVRENAVWIQPSPLNDGVLSPNEVPPEQPREPGELLPPLRSDIQAVLTVLARRKRSDDRPEPAGLDLRDTDLREARLDAAHLERANLYRAHLEGAMLQDTHLEDAILSGAYLNGAFLSGAHLEGADLTQAHLERALITQEQVYSARDHGAYAFLPPEWPADWRERLEQPSQRPSTTPRHFSSSA